MTDRLLKIAEEATIDLALRINIEELPNFFEKYLNSIITRE